MLSILVHNMLSKQALTVHMATFKFYKIIRGSTLTCVPRFQWFQCAKQKLQTQNFKTLMRDGRDNERKTGKSCLEK